MNFYNFILMIERAESTTLESCWFSHEQRQLHLSLLHLPNFETSLQRYLQL